MTTTLVVLNPVAGNTRVERVLESLEQRSAILGPYEIYETTGKEDLPALVRQRHREGVDTFIAIGGDGTVGSVAAGLVGTEARLAIVPTGTGNVIAHDAGIPNSLEEALDLIHDDAPIMRIDAMQVNDTYAFLNVSLGMSVGILRDADQQRKRKLGRLAYLWSGLRNLAAVNVQPVRLWTDDEPHELSVSEVLVANCPSIGLPDLSLVESRLDDGQVEVITFRTRHLLDYVGIILDFLLQRRRRRRTVQVFRVCSRLKVETDTPTDVQIDGDVEIETPVSVRVIRHAVRLISPLANGDESTGCQDESS
jgi:diacylglycerol kinase (ATP)